MKRLLVISLCLVVACTTTVPVKISTLPGPSAVQGRVVGSDGGALPGVTVTISDERNGQRTAVTSSEGRYAFNGIAPGKYRVTAALAGYGSATREITVTRDQVSVITVSLHSSVAETITVTAEAPMINQGAAVTTSYSAQMPKAGKRHAAIASPRDFVAEAVAARPQYARFEDHGFVDTSKERKTTFAIDVDRASYANIRRFLAQGHVPPPDAVRIEEMVNYFTYDLPQPTGSDPFSITTEVTGCPWNGANRLLRIGVQGRNLDQWRMAPNNLVFLLDVSGSMSPPERLPLIKRAFRVLVDQLRAQDRVAIVVYAGAAGLVLPPTSGADKHTILAALDNLQAGGSTAGGEGIELAYKVARDNFLEGGNNRVILATDGDFNVGTSSIEGVKTLIEQKRETGVFLSTIGVGDSNYQDALMETLADKGNGNYAYLDTLKEAEKVFRSELTGTLVTIAKDVKIQLDFDPAAVASYRQIGYENRAMANEDFRDDKKDAGELGAGHSVTALYEIVPKTSRGPIGTIALRYKEPAGTTAREVNATIVDEGRSVFEASPDEQFAAAVAEMGMLLRNSPHKGTSSWTDVAHLAGLARGADLDGLRGEFATLVESARLRLDGERFAVKE